jgi:hypothetical protein
MEQVRVMTKETLGALGAFLLGGGSIGGIVCLTLALLLADNGYSPLIPIVGAVASFALAVGVFAGLILLVPSLYG